MLQAWQSMLQMCDTMLHLGTNCCRLVAICSRCGTDVAAYAADAVLVIADMVQYFRGIV